MTVELKRKRIADTPVANRRNGEVIHNKLIPQLRMAVISLLRANRPSVSKVATKIANGATWNEIEGIFNAKYVRMGTIPDS